MDNRHGATSQAGFNKGINSIIIFLILLPMTILKADIVISHLPYQIENVSNKTYVLSGNLSSLTSGIRIGDNVHDIVLDLGNDTITFGSAGGDNNYGIGIYWNPYNIEIRGGTIIHNMGSAADSADNNTCIWFGNSHDILLNNVRAVANGIDGTCIDNNGTTYNLEIAGGVYRSDSRAFSSRCVTSGAVIRFMAEKFLSSPDDYHIKIHDISITNGPHVGIALNKSVPLNKAFIYDNYIVTDGINEMYPVYDGNTCHSSGNAYGISIYSLAPGSEIHHNTIRSGTRHEGNQGILLQEAKGEPDNMVKIYDNDILVSSGPTRVHPSGKVSALYWRFVPGEAHTWNQYNHIYNNKFYVKIDTDTNTTYIGRLAEAVSIFFYDSCANNVFEKNRCMVLEGQVNGFTEVAAIGFGIQDTTAPGFEGVKNNVFKYNYYNAPRNPVALGNSRGHPGNNIVLYRDTIDCSHTGPDSTTVVFDVTGAYLNHSLGNRLRDCIYLNRANDNDVVFSFQAYTDTDSLGQEVRFERTMRIIAAGYNNMPIVNANVTVRNNYGNIIFSGTTNENGYISDFVTYKYLAHDPVPNDDIFLQDSLYFNNFTVRISKNSDIKTESVTINATRAVDTLYLMNTYGTGAWAVWTDNECDQPPTIPNPVYPVDGEYTYIRPVFNVLNSYAGGCTSDLTYDFQLAEDSLMENIIYESAQNPEGLFHTTFSLPSGSIINLDRYRTYFWRARAYNGQIYTGWSEIQSFYTTENACGDVNLDQSVNVSDVVCLINYVFYQTQLGDSGLNSDVNCSNSINISDAVYLLNYIYSGGAQPCDLNGDQIPDCW